MTTSSTDIFIRDAVWALRQIKCHCSLFKTGRIQFLYRQCYRQGTPPTHTHTHTHTETHTEFPCKCYICSREKINNRQWREGRGRLWHCQRVPVTSVLLMDSPALHLLSVVTGLELDRPLGLYTHCCLWTKEPYVTQSPVEHGLFRWPSLEASDPFWPWEVVQPEGQRSALTSLTLPPDVPENVRLLCKDILLKSKWSLRVSCRVAYDSAGQFALPFCCISNSVCNTLLACPYQCYRS